MTQQADMLLLADPAVEAQMRFHLPGTPMVCCCDPYDALTEMGKQKWSTILLSAPREDYPGLCQAARRLQPSAWLLGLCPPANEPDIRRLVGQPLDDYLIYPLTAYDVSRIHRAAAMACPSPQGGLSPHQMAALVEASTNPASLESAVAELVGRVLGDSIAWIPADKLDNHRPLLLASGEESRILAAPSDLGAPGAEAETLLAALRVCLPALMTNARRVEGLRRLAVTDHLTGAYNRRYFYHLTDQILRRAAEKKLRATLLLWDIDNFKRYNDTYGYAAGDEILRDTVALMKHISRSHDVVARIGGDEFTVLFWDPDRPRSPESKPLEDACNLADRFRRAVEKHKFHSLGPEAEGALTISGGLATFPTDGSTCRDLLRKASHALRSVKTSGKNAIRIVG